MTAYAHGVLVVDQKTEKYTWLVMARDDEHESERLEGEAGPHPINYAHMISMLGGRGWEMFQVLPAVGDDVGYWFRKRLDD